MWPAPSLTRASDPGGRPEHYLQGYRVGFEIRDTGIGFTDENFDSFNTAYSEHKYERGGKGLGRFMWLEAFETVHVRTTFQAQDGDEDPNHWLRDFEFGFDYDPDAASATQIDSDASGTTVKLRGFISPYREECPTDIEILAQRLPMATHCLKTWPQSTWRTLRRISTRM